LLFTKKLAESLPVHHFVNPFRPKVKVQTLSIHPQPVHVKRFKVLTVPLAPRQRVFVG
jgi:hypothetical protein